MRPPYTVRPFNPDEPAWSDHLAHVDDAALHHWLATMSKEVEEPVVIDGDGKDVTEKLFLHMLERES